MTANRLVTSVEVKNYRSFENITFDGLSGINLLIGPNNSGKSNFLSIFHLFLHEIVLESYLYFHVQSYRYGKVIGFLDIFKEENNQELKENHQYKRMLAGEENIRFQSHTDFDQEKYNQEFQQSLKDLFSQLNMIRKKSEKTIFPNDIKEFKSATLELDNAFQRARSLLNPQQFLTTPFFLPQLFKNNKKENAENMSVSIKLATNKHIKVWLDSQTQPFNEFAQHKNTDLRNLYELPNIYFIRQYRHLESDNHHSSNDNLWEQTFSANEISGKTTSSLLGAWKETEDPKLDSLYSAINEITGNAIDVKFNDHNDLKVKIDDLPYFEFTHLGYGLMELLIMLCAIIEKEQAIFCIEEIELHLHPTWQWKLLNYLSCKTKHQYFISTHSSSMINAAMNLNKQHDDSATVFNLSFDYEKKESRVKNITEQYQESSEVLQGMGYRPSDLMFTDCVIWVEGPSDIIYIEKWIKRRWEYLIENNHALKNLRDRPEKGFTVNYQFNMTAGASIKYISYDEDELDVDQLIKALRIARNSFLVIDSDLLSSPYKTEPAKVNSAIAEMKKQLERASQLFQEQEKNGEKPMDDNLEQKWMEILKEWDERYKSFPIDKKPVFISGTRKEYADAIGKKIKEDRGIDGRSKEYRDRMDVVFKSLAMPLNSERYLSGNGKIKRKLDLLANLEDHSENVWITYGRDIENYFGTPDTEKIDCNNYCRFDDFMERKIDGKVPQSKTLVAKTQTGICYDFEKYNLGHSLDYLIKFILKSNQFVEAANIIEPAPYKFSVD